MSSPSLRQLKRTRLRGGARPRPRWSHPTQRRPRSARPPAWRRRDGGASARNAAPAAMVPAAGNRAAVRDSSRRQPTRRDRPSATCRNGLRPESRIHVSECVAVLGSLLTVNLFRPLDPVRLQPVADPAEQALLLEMEPAFALLGEAREPVLEPAERSLACDRDLEQLPQLGVGDGPDEFLHVAVAFVRVLRLDGQEPAGRILLDLLDRQRQLLFFFLTEAEHHPRFGVEHPGEFAALILERPAELFQVELQLLRHQRELLLQNGLSKRVAGQRATCPSPGTRRALRHADESRRLALPLPDE